jgi:hypothetical protein
MFTKGHEKRGSRLMRFVLGIAGLLLALNNSTVMSFQDTSASEVPDERTTGQRLFVVGDSISIQYGPYLEQYLAGEMRYARKTDDGGALAGAGVYEGQNGGDSRSVAGYLESRAMDKSFRPDILLVNCGLHDIRRKLDDNLAYQIAAEDYRKNLRRIYEVARGIGAKLIWVRTTPVVDSIHNRPDMEFHRFALDQAEYNTIADTVFASKGIPIIDLDGFTRKLGEDVYIDHVHFSEDVRALQAAFIAGFLSRLQNRP